MFVSFTYWCPADKARAVEWIKIEHYEVTLEQLAQRAYAQLKEHYPTRHERMTLVKILHEI